jgi:predicted DNA-binding transcriptional regulator AlpA
MTNFKKSAPEGRRLARPSAAARYLNVGRSTLYEWMRRRPGFPQVRHLSARVSLFDLDELDAYVFGGAA